MRELDEALMDRTTASINRRQKITSIMATTVFFEEKMSNSTSFVIRDVETTVQGNSIVLVEAVNENLDVTESEVSCEH
jgi:ethanolamine utilization cobalamin adenosyltransferase